MTVAAASPGGSTPPRCRPQSQPQRSVRCAHFHEAPAADWSNRTKRRLDCSILPFLFKCGELAGTRLPCGGRTDEIKGFSVMTRTPRGSPHSGDQALRGRTPGLPARGRSPAHVHFAPAGSGARALSRDWALGKEVSPRAAGPGTRGTSLLASMCKCLAPEASVQDHRRSRRNPQALSPHSSEPGDGTDENGLYRPLLSWRP